MKRRVFFLLLWVAALQVWGAANKFEQDIQVFEKRDHINPPPKRAILFIGSSSIRMWDSLEKDFPKYDVINRGFGGSEISDSVRFVDRIVVPYKPSIIVMYAGGNDINNGKTPFIVAHDFKMFVNRVHRALPGTKIAYISIAPNPARWSQIEKVREANSLIRAYANKEPRVSFIDIHSHMLGTDGKPKPDIFLPDRLHMNGNGYEIWKREVGRELEKLLRR